MGRFALRYRVAANRGEQNQPGDALFMNGPPPLMRHILLVLILLVLILK